MSAIGAARHLGIIQALTSVPDGDGGTIETWAQIGPPWPMALQPTSVRDLEQAAVSTILAVATHIATGRYRADITIQMRLTFAGRTFEITGLKNADERGIDLQLFLVEQL